MTAREPKQIITSIFKKYVKIEDNTIYADKLFMINSVISHLFKNKYDKGFSKTLVEHGEIINRYLNNEVDIYWEDGRIMVKELNSVNDETDGG